MNINFWPKSVAAKAATAATVPTPLYVVGKLISSMPNGTGWPCMRPLGTGLSKWTVRQGSLAKTLS